MIRVEAEAMPDGLPGHARILITGTPEPPGRVTYMLRREGYSTGFLGRNGWQTTEEALAPLDVVPVPEEGGWALVLGPEVSGHVVEAPYLLRLPDLNQEFGIFWPGIEEYVPGTVYVPRGARRDAAPADPTRVSFATAGAKPNPAPPVAPATAPPPQPAVDPPRPQAGTDDATRMIPPPSVPVWKKPVFIVLAMVLIIAGGVVGLFHERLFGAREERVDIAPPTPPEVRPTPGGTTPNRPPWPEGTDGLTPNEVVAAAPDAAGILRVALRRQEQGRYSDVIPLLQTAAERGEAEAAFALARLHDPVDFVAGRPFQEPNGYEAAKLYRQAAQRGHAGAEQRRAALRTSLEQRATAGDRDARDALAEFWP
jgi:hypothetical protein